MFPKYKELPFAAFKQIGITKEKLLKMNENLVHLLLLQRTQLIAITHPEKGTEIKAKLSLFRENDSWRLQIHPQHKKPINNFGLSYNTLKKLKDGKTIYKNYKTDLKNTILIYQLDKETNEILEFDLANINIDLNRAQLSHLKNTDTLIINGKGYRLDLSHPRGLVEKTSLSIV